MFASLRCSVDRAFPSATRRYHRVSSEWRDASRGPMAGIHFPLSATYANPITDTGRVLEDEPLGKSGKLG